MDWKKSLKIFCWIMLVPGLILFAYYVNFDLNDPFYRDNVNGTFKLFIWAAFWLSAVIGLWPPPWQEKKQGKKTDWTTFFQQIKPVYSFINKDFSERIEFRIFSFKAGKKGDYIDIRVRTETEGNGILTEKGIMTTADLLPELLKGFQTFNDKTLNAPK
jgi:hypothetical protein